ncbi:MAG: hypothetical protein NZ769_04060 [Anaerolineae bacterium]|nr:hypothetical protein [Anaerolineae bacterium]
METIPQARRTLWVSFALGILMALAWTWALAAPPEPPVHLAPPLRGPDRYTFTPLPPPPEPRIAPAAVTLKAVAIVGDVEGYTPDYKQDMDRAVAALQARGVAVEKFYYGDRSFTWADIVTAATGAHFLLYMGHGIWWSGPCTQPTLVGGFYLGPGQFVHPDRIRTDLNGRMAPGAIVILSHVCFSAGQTACDTPGSTPSQDEAARRVQMYAAPFVDIGLKAYFANNYYQSAANYVNQILADPMTRQTVGNIFKSIYPNNPSKFRDLSYPKPEYDLWLNGDTGDWHHAFVGIPSYRFTADLCELAPLPDVITFTYSLATGVLRPSARTVTPTVLNCSLTWTAIRSGNWFTVTPTSGRTSIDSLRIQPFTTTLSSYAVGRYTGTVTLTLTDSSGIIYGIQRMTVTVDVGRPRLADLPSALTFTYFLSDSALIPAAHVLVLRNTGSEDPLAWTALRSGTWFTFAPISGTTPQTLWITPTVLPTTPVTLMGRLTVTVVSPTGTLSPTQSISLTFGVIPETSWRVYLPCVFRY